MCMNRNVAILISKVLTQAMLAMGGPQHYLTVSIGWKVVLGMEDMGLLSALTVR